MMDKLLYRKANMNPICPSEYVFFLLLSNKIRLYVGYVCVV